MFRYAECHIFMLNCRYHKCHGAISVHRGKQFTVLKGSSLRKRVDLVQRKKIIGLTLNGDFWAVERIRNFLKSLKTLFSAEVNKLTANVGATTFRQFAVSSTTTDNWEHMDSTTCQPSFMLPATTLLWHHNTHIKNIFIIMHNCYYYYYFIPLNPICLPQRVSKK